MSYYSSKWGVTFFVNEDPYDGAGKHSFRDYGLYPIAIPDLPPPAPKTVYIDVPGSNGSLDLTESLTGRVQYGMREATFEFKTIQKREVWQRVYNQIVADLHGKRVKMVRDEEPDVYLDGRITVDALRSDKHAGRIAIKAVCDPFKRERWTTIQPWLWDPFNFDTGIFQQFIDLDISGTSENPQTLTVYGSVEPVCPVFKYWNSTSTPMTVIFNEQEFQLASGYGEYLSTILDIILVEGENTLQFVGNGHLELEFRRARL